MILVLSFAFSTDQYFLKWYQAEIAKRTPPRRAILAESFLAYMHLPKTGGSSFNKMLLEEPLALAGSLDTTELDMDYLNCGYIPSCCNDRLLDKYADKVLGKCPHITYETYWPFWESVLSKKQNALLLTHLRSPFWHVLSMLGHDLMRGRYDSYTHKLSGEDPRSGHSSGYEIDNHIHHKFDTGEKLFLFFFLLLCGDN